MRYADSLAVTFFEKRLDGKNLAINNSGLKAVYEGHEFPENMEGGQIR